MRDLLESGSCKPSPVPHKFFFFSVLVSFFFFFAAAKTGLGLTPQVGELPEGREEETPTSAPKAPALGWPRKEGSRGGSRGKVSPANTALCWKTGAAGGSEPKLGRGKLKIPGRDS